MNKMKILAALLLVCSTTSFAAASQFEEKKQKFVEHIGKRITILQSFKECVEASATKEAIKSCKATKKEAIKALKASRKK